MHCLFDKARPYINLMRLNRPIGILLLLWPTLSALWIAAAGQPELKNIWVFIFGVIIMRSAGCVINDFADRKVDGLVSRTKNRPLASGALTSKQALTTFFILLMLALVLVMQLNHQTQLLSIMALFLAVIYPFMKRYTYLPQVVLGAAFGMAIPMAFTAETNHVPLVGWLLFLAHIFWTTAYDTFYAMADREDDLLAGIKSTAILFGDDDQIIIGLLQLSFLFVMLLVGQQLAMGVTYYLSILIVLALFAYQHFLAKDKDSAQCLQAFLNNNWVGASLFFGIVGHYMV